MCYSMSVGTTKRNEHKKQNTEKERRKNDDMCYSMSVGTTKRNEHKKQNTEKERRKKERISKIEEKL